jgi:hypothetical protein
MAIGNQRIHHTAGRFGIHGKAAVLRPPSQDTHSALWTYRHAVFAPPASVPSEGGHVYDCRFAKFIQIEQASGTHPGTSAAADTFIPVNLKLCNIHGTFSFLIALL